MLFLKMPAIHSTPVLPADEKQLREFALTQYREAERLRQDRNEYKKKYDEQKEALRTVGQAYRENRKAYREQERAYRELEEKFTILQKAFFGRSSERWTADDHLQARLFDEAELAVDEEEAGSQEEIVTARRKKKVRGKREKLPESLPREEVILDIPEEEKICGCGARLKKIGEEVSEKLEIIPATIKVIRTIRPKYACRVCEGSGDEENPAVKIAPVPEDVFPKSIATAGLVAHIITGKYCDALPLYRQEKMFRRIGVDLKRSSMARWIIDVGSRLSPLLELMDREIQSGQVVLMDETRIQVHKEAGRSNHGQSFMWVARGGPPNAPVIRYMYHPSRGGAVARDYLKDYKGFLQTDGYEAYRQIGEAEGVIHVGCLAHARRKFDEASKVSGGSRSAMEFIAIIQKIYLAEKALHGMKNEDRDEYVRLRKEQVLPLFEKLEKQVEKKLSQVTPSTALGKAVTYLADVLPRIVRYLDSPYLTPDTNAVERVIRPFAVGRKNWLFADTPRGAHASAALYSLIETAKASSLEPYWYIRYVLQYLPTVERTGDWKALLPGKLDQDMLKA